MNLDTNIAAQETISVVIPCYNEAAALPELFRRVTSAAVTWPYQWEIICVDDGSKDATWPLLLKQQQKDHRWRALSFARNFGHQTAVSAGIFHASGDAVVIIDADLQDPPEEISRLLEKWREGFEVVLATRKTRQDPLVKKILAWGFYRVLRELTPLPMARDAGDFCLLDKKVVAVINSLPERSRYLRGLRTWCGYSQTSVEFERAERSAGEPKYTFRKSLKLAMDGIFSFSEVPLRLATYLGLSVSALAFLGVIFTILQKIFAREFTAIGLEPRSGYPTVIISILFLGGVQLTCIGILGEYIGRIYEEVKRRPPWVIRNSAGLDPQSPKS